MKCFLFCLLLMRSGFCPILAQDFDIPPGYEFKNKDDYRKYEKEVVRAAQWLVAVPFNEQVEKRKQVSRFVVTWINGSPTVNVEINPTIMDFEKTNPGMLVVYMAGCARYVLENNYSRDMRAKHKAALKGMMDIYQKGKGIARDRKMERLIKSEADGKMDKWLDDYLKIEGGT
jgi:hypothetical protein